LEHDLQTWDVNDLSQICNSVKVRPCVSCVSVKTMSINLGGYKITALRINYI